MKYFVACAMLLSVCCNLNVAVSASALASMNTAQQVMNSLETSLGQLQSLSSIATPASQDAPAAPCTAEKCAQVTGTTLAAAGANARSVAATATAASTTPFWGESVPSSNLTTAKPAAAIATAASTTPFWGESTPSSNLTTAKPAAAIATAASTTPFWGGSEQFGSNRTAHSARVDTFWNLNDTMTAPIKQESTNLVAAQGTQQQGWSSHTYITDVCAFETTRVYGQSPTTDRDCEYGRLRVGSGGSASRCRRSFSLVTLSLELPQTDPDTITEVQFTLDIQSSGGGGIGLVLHGLGLRDTEMATTNTDYYAGVEDPTATTTLINGALAAKGLSSGTTVQDSSATLRDYVKDQMKLGQASGKKFLMLRISGDKFNGCDASCDGSCKIKRYYVQQPKLTVTATGPVPTSAWAFSGQDGTMQYKTSEESSTLGDTMLDFGAVGYKYGSELPEVATVSTLHWATGDQADRINQAILDMASTSIDINSGFRGALQLDEGEWEVSKAIRLGVSGVVLKGSGAGTVIKAPKESWNLGRSGPTKGELLQVGGSSDMTRVGQEVAIVYSEQNPRVPHGAKSLMVADSSSFQVGDNVRVVRKSNTPWIEEIEMHDIENCDEDTPPGRTCKSWQANYYQLLWDRTITAVEGNTITLDLPLSNSIEEKWGGGVVYKYSFPGRVHHVGVQDIVFEAGYTLGEEDSDEGHAWTAVAFENVKDAFALRLTCYHFGFACVDHSANAKSITTKDCHSKEPVSRITGGRRYAFNLDDATGVLVTGCTTDKGRHEFVTGSATMGPNVFHNCVATKSNSDIGPHHRWATGLLFDGVKGGDMSVENRGSMGSGHGWSGAFVVYWNCESKVDYTMDGEYSHRGLMVDAAPTSLSWSIGNIADAAGKGTGRGIWESFGRHVSPASLYEVQKWEHSTKVKQATGASVQV